MSGPKIFLSAGEPSGDLHGGAVAEALRRRWPDARMYGLGGPRMAAAGVELMAHVDDLAVMGLAEVAKHLPYFLRLLRQVRARLRTDPPDLVLPVDYPGFNFRLCRLARDVGRPVLYYIAPQVWAWRRRRARTLAQLVDRLAVILPFEEALFAANGARTTFVGHPLLDAEPEPALRADFCATLGLDPARPILALFPGSRVQEVQRHVDIFAAAAKETLVYQPDVQPVIAAGGAIPAGQYATAPYPRTLDSWGLLQHAQAAIVKSGTSTLQAALCRTPMVVAYRMSPLTFSVARRVVHVAHVGLVNLVAGERIVPELLQNEATPAALSDAILPFCDPSHPARARATADLELVRARLRPREGTASVAERVVALAAELLAA
jgi:lipid-A-disaccharide synthase